MTLSSVEDNGEMIIVKIYGVYEGVYEDVSLCGILATDGSHVIQISKNLGIGEGFVQGYEKESYYQWMIVLKELDEPIGSISVVRQNDRVEKAEIGSCIVSQWWHAERYHCRSRLLPGDGQLAL